MLSQPLHFNQDGESLPRGDPAYDTGWITDEALRAKYVDQAVIYCHEDAKVASEATQFANTVLVERSGTSSVGLYRVKLNPSLRTGQTLPVWDWFELKRLNITGSATSTSAHLVMQSLRYRRFG